MLDTNHLSKAVITDQDFAALPDVPTENWLS